MAIVILGIAAAWVLVVALHWTGSAELLHHHTLIEGGDSFWVTLPLFFVGWQVMIVAMMLPASLPTIRLAEAAIEAPAATPYTCLAFLGAFGLVWTAFGLVAFMGDAGLQQLAQATPWLERRPWLIEAAVLALAGAYQLSALKRWTLELCRHPMDLLATTAAVRRGPLQLGIQHGLACLGSSWALMLLMFAEGFANLWWMAALAVVMAWETMRLSGPTAARAVGLGLLGLSMATLAIGVGGA